MLDLFGDEIPEVVEVKPDEKAPVPKLFDWLGSINTNKKDLRYEMVSDKVFADPELKSYSEFIINKGLGQSEATVGYANLMNRMPHIPKDMQYTFLRTGIPSHRSFAKWAKTTKFDNLQEVMAKLGYNETKAKEAILVLGEAGVKQLLKQKGGKQ